MTVETIYIADDGTKFDDENSCLQYERKTALDKIKNSIFLFDDNGNELPLDDKGFEQCYFVVSKSDKASRIAWELLQDEYGAPFNECRAGIWYYDYDEWHSVDGEFLSLQRIIAKLQMIFEGK